MEIQSSIEDIIKYLKNDRMKSMENVADEVFGIVLTGFTIYNMFTAKDLTSAVNVLATGASISAVKLSGFIEFVKNKFSYLDKGRGLKAQERYERICFANLLIIHLSAKEALRNLILDAQGSYLVNYSIDKTRENEIKEYLKREEKALLSAKVRIPSLATKVEVADYLQKIYRPIKEILNEYSIPKDNKEALDGSQIVDELIESAIIIYNAYIINLSDEYPDMILWADLSQKASIINYCSKLANQLEIQGTFIEAFDDKLNLIQELLINDKYNDLDFKKYEVLTSRQTEDLKGIINEDLYDNICAYHNGLRSYLNKPIYENVDVDGIVFPNNQEMFVPHSYRFLKYSNIKYGKNILLPDFWETTENGVSIEKDIAKRLSLLMLDKDSSFNPIVIMGNPGAGKSMLSGLIAAKYTESKEFVPFLIKLREISSSNPSVDSHINQGIERSILGCPTVNWVTWIKQFPTRIPIIILDGFDELLQTGGYELRGYLESIRNLQEQVFEQQGIAVKVILTSRLTMLEQVAIPDGTLLIKLDSFDDNRRQNWINKWNTRQTKEGFMNFKVPDNEHIEELSREPLLLLLLAIYDFEGNELQNAAQDSSFSQSKLYNKLFERFSIRQLRKMEKYKNLKDDTLRDEKAIERFRLRIGLIAFMMYLSDSTSHNSKNLDKELKQFSLYEADMKIEEVYTGFFFVHDNKSVNELGHNLYDFEFLHKTFGEFLAADFLLRIASYRLDDDGSKLSKESTFRFCYGYNWLNKHSKTASFLIEHADEIITDDKKAKLEKFIKKELASIFDVSQLAFPVSDIQLPEVESQSVINHMAIYSQNLIILWLSQAGNKNNIKFNIPVLGTEGAKQRREDDNQLNFDVSEDIDESDMQKSLWKKLVKLWIMTGNSSSAANLRMWLDVVENKDEILLRLKKNEVNHYFHIASLVSCNDYEFLLSCYQVDFKVNDIMEIISQKPRLAKIAFDLMYEKFDDIWFGHFEEIYTFFEYVTSENSDIKKLFLTHKLLIKLLNLDLENYPHLKLPQNEIKLEELMRNNMLLPDEKIKLFLGLIRLYSHSSNRIHMFDNFDYIFGNCSNSELTYLASNKDFIELSNRYCRNIGLLHEVYILCNDAICFNKILSASDKLELVENIFKRHKMEQKLLKYTEQMVNNVSKIISPISKEYIRLLEITCIHVENPKLVDKLLKNALKSYFRKDFIVLKEKLRLLELILLYSSKKFLMECKVGNVFNILTSEIQKNNNMKFKPMLDVLHAIYLIRKDNTFANSENTVQIYRNEYEISK